LADPVQIRKADVFPEPALFYRNGNAARDGRTAAPMAAASPWIADAAIHGDTGGSRGASMLGAVRTVGTLGV